PLLPIPGTKQDQRRRSITPAKRTTGMAIRKATRWVTRYTALTTLAANRLLDAVHAGKRKAERIYRLFEAQHRPRSSLFQLQQHGQQTGTCKTDGVCYLIFDNSWNFYLGSTEREPLTRWTEHLRKFEKREKFRSSRALYFLTLRHGPIDHMRAVERYLIATYSPAMNKVHNNHEDSNRMQLPKEILQDMP
ncbi:unnamed protein product, partial [Amoebophrya sp. A120]